MATLPATTRRSLLALTCALLACGRPASSWSPSVPSEVPRATTRTGAYWHVVDGIEWQTAEGSRAVVRLWLALPPTRPGQRVRIGAIVPPPTDILRDEAGDNRVAYWELERPAEHEPLFVHYELEVTNEAVAVAVDPARVVPVRADDPARDSYTRSEPWLEATPQLARTARTIVGDVTNPYYRAKRLFEWVVDQLTYDYPDLAQRGAAQSLARGSGDCGEFSHVFVALARALGIPARVVYGTWYQGGNHAWAEVYLPPYGWIPADPTSAQLVANGSKGQRSLTEVERFLHTRGVPSADPDWFFGNLYAQRLELFVGENVTVTSDTTERSRTFRFMQPGGAAALPAAIELAGLGGHAVSAGFFLWGDDATDQATVTRRAEQELAIAYLGAGQLARAMPALERTVERSPDDVAAWFRLGTARFHMGRHDAALQALQRSLRATGGGSLARMFRTWANIYIGMIFDLRGDRARAGVAYRAALELGSDHAGARATARRLLQSPYLGSSESPGQRH